MDGAAGSLFGELRRRLIRRRVTFVLTEKDLPPETPRALAVDPLLAAFVE